LGSPAVNAGVFLASSKEITYSYCSYCYLLLGEQERVMAITSNTKPEEIISKERQIIKMYRKTKD